jgi:curved DNA-binding protein
MIHAGHEMSLIAARQILGVAPFASEAEVRRAFRLAAKRSHPDRAGGDETTFRLITQAYERLKGRGPAPMPPPPGQRPSEATGPTLPSLPISPSVAYAGGLVEHTLEDGRRLRITLPAGMRPGDRVRAAGVELAIAVAAQADMQVRGDDLWISVEVEPGVLKEGGRLALATPIGRRIVWINRMAGERGLVRLEGQGLPARGRHTRGHLFLRLSAIERPTETAARTLLRRFTAAWAA